MGRKNKKTQLAILSILAGVVYLMIVATYFVRNWEAGKRAFFIGYERSKMYTAENAFEGYDVFTLDVLPKNYRNAYTDSLINIKNGRNIPVCHERIEVQYEYSKPLSSRMIIHQIIHTITAFPALIMMLLIPFLFYTLIISFYNDAIFTHKNVKLLKHLAVYSIAIYVLQLIFNISYFITSKSLIEFANYKQIMPDLDHEILLTGIVLLIAANVMQRAIVLKEEQELTI